MNADHAARLASLTTAHLADACILVDVPVRCAPGGTRPLAAATRVAGRVLPARHAGSGDVFLADDDGAVFLPDDRVAEILDVAEGIRDAERRQAERIRGGNTLRQQVEFASFLENRKRNANLTFREHLRAVGGAIEE